MKYRQNRVIFSMIKGYSLLSGSYTINSFSVTEGQDPKGKIFAGLKATCESDGTMAFCVGRSQSVAVANWFNDKIPSANTTFNHTAGELHFAFLGTLELTVKGEDGYDTFTFSNIALAQGYKNSNNWWFGGLNCSYIQNHQVSAQGTNSNGDTVHFDFLRGSNANSYTVQVTPNMATS